MQEDADTGYLFGNWSVRNFNSGQYEIVLHAICSTLGYAEPGIDDTWSEPVVGTIQLVDRHRVIESSQPPNMGTGYMDEEISATFNIPVDCDKDNGNYWFDVMMEQRGEEIPSTYYTLYCEDRTIYMKPTGIGVRCTASLMPLNSPHFAITILQKQFANQHTTVSIIHRNAPTNVWKWEFNVLPRSCPGALFAGRLKDSKMAALTQADAYV